MEYLFNNQVADNLIARINRLSPGSKPLWGKMTVTQMLAHCQVPMQVALGERKLKRHLLGVLFGPLAKKTVISDKPFKRGLPTDPSFVVKVTGDFDQEKAKLIALIQKFNTGKEGALTRDPHPFFGRLTAQEWNKSQWKHIEHHLQQFGV